MRKAEAKEHYVAGLVWNVWADYWISKGQEAPPFAYLRTGGGEDFIFVTATSGEDLDGFIQTVKGTPDLKFSKQGNWWLPGHFWFGDWSVFSASVRQGFFGFARPIFSREEVIDFEGTGDSRMTQLHSGKSGEVNGGE
jgi:hypothetical protein